MLKIPVKLLYIEDSYEAYRLTKSLLEGIKQFDAQLDWVSNWNDGIDKISRNIYDVCLLDYQLGAKTGLDFLKASNAFNLRTPVVYLTQTDNASSNARVMEAGACDYIEKKLLDPNILERTIRHAIERKKFEFQIIEVTEELAIALKEIKDNQSKVVEIENLKSVKALAGAVAHEFSQPLQALSNYLSLIKSCYEDSHNYVSNAEDMILRISELTDNLRNITGLSKKNYMGSKILDLKFESKKNENKACSNKVLIVDDEDVILDTLVEMFEIKGFTSHGTTDAEEALELIKANTYDLIISDVSMPVMSGPDFFKRVKAMGVKSTFIFITGYEIPNKIKNIIDQADGLIVKPVSFDQFFKNFENLEN